MCTAINPEYVFIDASISIVFSYRIDLVFPEVTDTIFNIQDQPDIEWGTGDAAPTGGERAVILCLMENEQKSLTFSNALVDVLVAGGSKLKIKHSPDITQDCAGAPGTPPISPNTPACIDYNHNGNAVPYQNGAGGPMTIYYNRANIDKMAEDQNAPPETVLAEVMIHEIGHPHLGATGTHGSGLQPTSPGWYVLHPLGEFTADVYREVLDDNPFDEEIYDPPGFVKYALPPGSPLLIPECFLPIINSPQVQESNSSVRASREALETVPGYSIEYVAGENPHN